MSTALATAVTAALIWRAAGVPAPGVGGEPPLVTRAGDSARRDVTVSRALASMHAYMALGVRSDSVREAILSPELAEALGRSGRAQVVNVLDYVRQLTEARFPSQAAWSGLLAALAALNGELQSAGFGYYVYGELVPDETRHEGARSVALPAFEIAGARRYQAGGVEIPVIHVQSLDQRTLFSRRLGMTAPGHTDVLVLVERVEDEIAAGVLPACDPDGVTTMFGLVGDGSRAPWYRALRREVARSLALALGPGCPATVHGDRVAAPADAVSGALIAAARARARVLLVRAVELHEVQHQLDFARELATPAALAPLAEEAESSTMARSGVYEVSAHLSQIARDPEAGTVTLALLTSSTFVDLCDFGDCLAALGILDAIGRELGLALPPLLDGVSDAVSYDLRLVARYYAVITAHAPDRVSAAARVAWERMFVAPLIPVTRVR